MAEIDTSSYPKPALPVSPLDIAGKLGGLEQQKLGIDQAKLNQANQALGYMTRAFGSLGPDATKDQYFAVGQNAVKMGLVPQQMLDVYKQRLDAAPTAKDFFNEFTTAAGEHQQTLDYHLGRPGLLPNGQTIQPTMTSQKPGFGVRSVGSPIQLQPPPTTGVVTPEGQPRLYGANPADIAPGSGAVSGPPPVGRLPIAPLPTGPVTSPAVPGQSRNFGGNVLGASVEAPKPTPALPAARGPMTGLAPGVGEAETVAGGASGTQLAQDRAKAAAFQRDIFPLAQAIPAMETLGTKGSGPGTETINHLKSFILSNVPGVTENTPGFKNIKTYDEAKKYLTDFVNQTGNSGTNDKLAAAFAGNPSVGISNAAAVDVAKSALSLRRMQQAVYQEFEQQKLPASQYSRWIAQRTNETDPRAFGVDMMNNEAKTKLKEQLNRNAVEKKRFEESLNLAHNLGFITPSR